MYETMQVNTLFENLRSSFVAFLNNVGVLCFEQCKLEINEFRTTIKLYSEKCSECSDAVINELYVLNRFVDLLSTYTNTWEKIVKSEFSNSWQSLQGCLDCLRDVKKFSKNPHSQTIIFFENQLLELEKLYPYNIFVSIGAIVDLFECSICGKDIDSFDCEHIRGELYRGKMAYGIAKNLVNVDHIAMTKNPKDKRCVVQYDDEGPQFTTVRYLSGLLKTKNLTPLSFHHLEFKKRNEKNLDFKMQPRNGPCFCGSGRRFKKCCINNEFIEKDHVDIVEEKTFVESLFA